jgi:tetratricopeptide (TPR) repeat protein
LPLSFGAAELRRLNPHGAKTPEAQALAERADALMYQVTPASLARSIEYAQQAIALDPTFGLPYGQIATAYALIALTDVMPPAEARARTREWTQRARSVDDQISTSHIATLDTHADTWDWTLMRRAGSLDPFYDYFLIASGRAAELLPSAGNEGAEATFLGEFHLAQAFFFARQYDRADSHFQKSIELNPTFVWTHYWLGRTATQQHRFGDAVEHFKAAAVLRRTPGALGYALAASGRRREAERMLADLTGRARREYVTPINFAWIEIGLGNREEAFAWLQKACTTHVPEFVNVKVDPIYDPLRLDPRFQSLVACVHLE